MERKPSQVEVVRFISSLLPSKTTDVSFLYHLSRYDGYNFENTPVEQVVLSVTPTPAVYKAIGEQVSDSEMANTDTPQGHEESRPPHTIAFLHRPFTLDRSRVRNNLPVLASRTSFDEHLTIGWNPILARRLGVDMAQSLCVQGHKGDPERKIGLVARVSTLLGHLLCAIEEEFGGIEHAQEGLSEEIYVLAMMNAFSADDVHRMLDMAQEQNWVPYVEGLGRHVLYLTGQPRKSGLEAAKESGTTVVCVGHRVTEQWGISYMASCIRTAFPAVQVNEIYEDELSEGRA
jgi:putative NIF3 family GTP cyclohydrolase 1 type 2